MLDMRTQLAQAQADARIAQTATEALSAQLRVRSPATAVTRRAVRDEGALALHHSVRCYARCSAGAVLGG